MNLDLSLSNPLFATGHLALWLLIGGLFLPRLALVFAFLGGVYPPNPMPILFNFLGWLLLPRFLLAYYVYINIGPNNFWFWAYIITGLFGMFGEGHQFHHRVIRRYYPNGAVEYDEV